MSQLREFRRRLDAAKAAFVEPCHRQPMKGCAFKPEQVEALIKHDPETLAMWRDAVTAPVGRPTIPDIVRNLESDGHGNSRSYTVSRLKKERPDLFDEVVAGHMSARDAPAGKPFEGWTPHYGVWS